MDKGAIEKGSKQLLTSNRETFIKRTQRHTTRTRMADYWNCKGRRNPAISQGRKLQKVGKFRKTGRCLPTATALRSVRCVYRPVSGLVSCNTNQRKPSHACAQWHLSSPITHLPLRGQCRTLTGFPFHCCSNDDCATTAPTNAGQG